MIEVKNLTKAYAGKTVLERLDLELGNSEAAVILGPSGSGKTTLLRLLAGLDVPDSGEIRMDGELVSRPGYVLEPHKRQIGFVFQTSNLWPHMTVRRNISFGLGSIRQAEVRGRLNEVLKEASIEDLAERYPDEISGGEASRTAIARALAPNPKYLFLDEPLIHLDPELKLKIMAYILESWKRTRASMIYVTHDRDEATEIPGYTFYLRSGRLERMDSAP